jgi:Protein of unknown function (DUF3617)
MTLHTPPPSHPALLALLSLVAATLLPAASLAQAPGPAAEPKAGQWQLTHTMEGAPMVGGSRTRTACLKAEALGAAPEQALLDAATEGLERTPRCRLGAITRKGEDRRWQAQCQGPRGGAVTAEGRGTLSAGEALLHQQMQLDSPMGKLSLRQVVQAQRLGDC